MSGLIVSILQTENLVGSIMYIGVLKSRVGSSGFVALMGDYVSELIAICL